VCLAYLFFFFFSDDHNVMTPLPEYVIVVKVRIQS